MIDVLSNIDQGSFLSHPEVVNLDFILILF
jgi:hypothetical protein